MHNPHETILIGRKELGIIVGLVRACAVPSSFLFVRN